MTKKKTISPPLKSTSGAGYTYEDKVAAALLCEMLVGQQSLGGRWGVTQKLERQASDWEPFGDILLTIPNNSGKLIKCGCSVKSNKQVNSNGCTTDLCAGLWASREKHIFTRGEDGLALFCSPLGRDVHRHLHALCNQASESDPVRLNQKTTHLEIRRIYDSFQHPSDSGDDGLPGHVLANLIPREFDFEDASSRAEAEAIRLCGECLSPGDSVHERAAALWGELLAIAQALRVAGGDITRETLTAKLRLKFKLRDDPGDAGEWSHIRKFSSGWMAEIDTTLPGGFTIPRSKEVQDFRKGIAKRQALPVLGESGSGKSALAKLVANEFAAAGAEVVWIKAERFGHLCNKVPNFAGVCQRTRRGLGLLIFDAMEGCYEETLLKLIAQTIRELLLLPETPWQIIVICQTHQWSRVASVLAKYIGDKPILTGQLEFLEISDEDFSQVCAAHPSVARLSRQAHLKRVLKLPKMLDILLAGQLAENRELASEADLVDWWWEQQVRGASAIAAEERVARQLATRMADELCTELAPDAVAGDEKATDNLVRNRVLRVTLGGRIGFHHDLLADWSRVKHLLSLGDSVTAFMLEHAQNPPWLRAIRLLSQYLLDRSAKLDLWRNILSELSACTKDSDEQSAESLQVLDVWLEGVAFCGRASEVLESLKEFLFNDEGMLLRRFLRRLLHIGTFPDPIIQKQWRQRDAKVAASAAIFFRWPIFSVWQPVVELLIRNPGVSTDYAGEELAEIGTMWARFAECLQLPWPAFADLVLLNAEKELRREVGGVFRSHRGVGTGSEDPRVAIYNAGLFAGSEHPERATKLSLKAAGRVEWERGDVAGGADDEWTGRWRETTGAVFLRRSYTGATPSAWEIGPRRRTSSDFALAWLKGGAARAIFRYSPKMACEATLGFLIRWPKFKVDRNDSNALGSENHGFSSVADDLKPPFWTQGPFLPFFGEQWQLALDLVIQLVNFATDRYADWWPYEPVAEIRFKTPATDVCWKGNPQVYAWHRYHMNVVEVVSCALMALEKWMEDCLNAGESVSEAIKMLFQQGTSLAFAGVLISLGKRHPKLFLGELKPLLSVQELYMIDFGASHDANVGDFWPQDSKLVREERRKWNSLPGRKTRLLDDCVAWYLERPEFGLPLEEVAAIWREKAKSFANGSEDRLILLRWASNFNRSVWNQVTTPDGKKHWVLNRPAELRDTDAEKEQMRQSTLLTLPMQCAEALSKRQPLDNARAEALWKCLNNQSLFEPNSPGREKNDLDSAFRDPGHARAGVLAMMLSLGHAWLLKHPNEHAFIVSEVRKLLTNPPEARVFGPEDFHDDGEAFLARCAVQLWSESPTNEEWRGTVGGFVTLYRYHTVRTLFDEAYHVREALGPALQELQALALAFAAVRKKANASNYYRPDTELLMEWSQKWLPSFATGKGPGWPVSWASVESLDKFPGVDDEAPDTFNYRKQGRRDYGFDMGVVLAAFAHLPPLTEAANADERERWINIGKELLRCFLLTLPPAGEGEEWEHSRWKADETIFSCIASRLFECDHKDQRDFWQPFLDLPTAAHDHIVQFLRSLYLESIRTEPPRVMELLQIWRDLIDYLFSLPEWAESGSRNCQEVWKNLFLYGSCFTGIGDEVFIPFFDALESRLERHVRTHLNDPYDQSAFAGFLTTKAGERTLVKALAWLLPSWKEADGWFWKTAAERSNLGNLLECARRTHFADIMKNSDALKAFKILTLQLAAHQVPVALEVQGQIGTNP